MPETHIAVAQEANRHAPDRLTAAATAKAKRLWPGVIGEVLADEITALMDLPLWLRSQTRTQRLIDAVLRIPEGTGKSRDDRPAAISSQSAGSPSPDPQQHVSHIVGGAAAGA
jgi:hypothetical protein